MAEYKYYPSDKDFESWWQIYPKKRNKGDAKKAWAQTAAIRPPVSELIKAVIVACSTEDWTKAEGQYIPLPASYLRGERWEDTPEIELQGVVNGKMWWETTAGVDGKAKELGMAWDDKAETYQQFTRRVRKAAEGVVNAPLRAVA